jgi:nucleoside-diphosphate-sugar epimerase
MNKPKVAIMGCGWLGLPLGRHLVEQGYAVQGSTTSVEKLPQLKEAGIQPFHLEVEASGMVGEDHTPFFEADILVLNIPPGRRQGDVRTRYPNQIRWVLDACEQGTIKKIILVSSTSVYPNTNGIVTEDTTLEPATDSGHALIEVETLVQSAADIASTVLRMAGLAGGSREPGRFYAGKSGLQDGDVPVNFVHQDDCIGIIQAVMEQEKWGQVYNVCADEHPIKRRFYPARAVKKGLHPPDYSLHSDAGYKIVANEKVRRELGYSFKYPDPMVFP